jgi:ABC-type sugar transport system substrate-binding protein
MKRVSVLLAALAWLAVGATPAPSAQDLPIFDVHIHYSHPAWDAYPPGAALAILDRGGVGRALVSSTPDDGTLRLHAVAPDRIVPEVRPYRTPGDMGSWTKDRAVLAYVEERLKRGIYKGIGEFHLGAGEVGDPVPRAFVDLAALHGIFLHCHCDEGAVEGLAKIRTDARVLWAHAGMSASAATVERLLDRYPNLWVELALRSDVAPGGAPEPAWRALFLKHADRFMVGTDTWVNSQWDRLPAILDGFRAWLRQLPPDVAAKIAHGNADRLFGGP